jgi:hypothetical protein
LIASLESNNFRKSGLSFTARYTLSGAKDNLSSTFAETGQTFFLGFTDTFNPGLDRGWADFDVRHRFVTSFNYQPKFFENGNSSLARQLLGGWSLNGTVTIRSGFPFTIYDCSFVNSTCARILPSGPITINGNPTDTGDANSFQFINLDNQRNPDGSLKTPAPTNGLISNYNFGPFPANMTARNAFRGPGFWDVTTGLYKRIRFSERLSLQLRAEVFNLFNHANQYINYGSPDVSGVLGDGNVLSTRGNNGFPAGLERRNVQLAAKFIF